MTRRTPSQYDWDELEFDETILTRHFTAQSSKDVRFIVVHHMTIVGSGNGSALTACYNVWQNREASAHYGVDGKLVRQFVWDKDYAWATGSSYGNRYGISIEHANSTAGPKWLVSETTWKTGARLAAYLHKVYKLGRPVSGKTLRKHSSFTATACPGPYLGGTAWSRYVAEAQRVYDVITGKTPAPKPVLHYVKVERAYGRSEPEITPNKSNVVTSLGFGKPLNLYPHNDSWGYTIYEGKKRYWIRKYLSKTKPVAPTTTMRKRVMTFNVADKFGGPISAIAADIKAGNPHIVGIQEGGGRKGPGIPADHAAAIAKALGWKILTPTTDFNENYFLYDPTKVSAKQLTDVIIRVEGAAGKHVSRAIFTDLASGQKLPVCNAHLEHQHGAQWDAIRQSQGVILADAAKSAQTAAGTDYVVVLADLNTSKAINALIELGLKNVATMTGNTVDLELATFSGSSATPSTDPARDLDHILVTADCHVHGVRVVSRRVDGKYVMPKGSDHQPVVADITF